MFCSPRSLMAPSSSRTPAKLLPCKAKATLTRDEEAKIIGQVTTNWDFNTAKNLAEANLTAATAADKGNVFILAPNDGTARAIADAFAADKDVKSYVSPVRMLRKLPSSTSSMASSP